MLYFICKGTAELYRKINKRNNSKSNYMFPSGNEPATVDFLAGHVICLAIGTVKYMCLILLQYNEVTSTYGAS